MTKFYSLDEVDLTFVEVEVGIPHYSVEKDGVLIGIFRQWRQRCVVCDEFFYYYVSVDGDENGDVQRIAADHKCKVGTLIRKDRRKDSPIVAIDFGRTLDERLADYESLTRDD